MPRTESDDNEARLRVDDWNGDRPPRSKAHQEPREPAPGEADPLAEHEARGGDQRTSSIEE